MKVELKNVSKRLNDVTVLEDISLTLEAGTIYGLKERMAVERPCLCV